MTGLLLTLLLTSSALAQSVYHEAWCPSVDATRMTRMKRHVAEAQGMVPAPDCHMPGVRYLGELHFPPGTSISPEPPRRTWVDAHERNGRPVRGHWRNLRER